MTEWGKRKDGQSYPKDGKKGVHSSNTAPVSDVHLKEKIIEDRNMSFYGEPMGEYELDDILEDVTLENIEKVAKDNIIFTLKREHKWKEDYHLIFPAGSLQEFRDDDTDEGGFYQSDYEIFDTLDHIKYAGTAYGSVSNGTMLDMTVELYERKP